MAKVQKPRRGRPPLRGVAGDSFHVRLPRPIADQLREFGAGSLTEGIIRKALGQRAARA